MIKDWQSEVLIAVKEQNLLKIKEIFFNIEDFEKQFTTKTGKTLLHFASNIKSKETLAIVQFLLDAGLDPEALDENFESALDVAKRNNNVPALALLTFFINKRNLELENYL